MRRFLWFSGLILLMAPMGCRQAPKPIDFNTQVKPIINKNCITCHGGVKRNAHFSLLFQQDALDTAESGKPAIIPGDPDHSELIRRLSLTDPEEKMPFKKTPLSSEEITILRQWIQEGAPWGEHWAYVPPKPVDVPRPASWLPAFLTSAWAKNDVDYFVSQKLKEQGLEHAAAAGKATLARRLSLDLIGLPPTAAQVEALVSDQPDAYEKLVDALLASPQFGEKWASWWLDMARYSDTRGYEKDNSRNIWRYRDYVIRSFNEDKPFDQFTLEQLAGDLLPHPTDEQMIATAFHRNTMNNDEGGTVDEEYRVAAVIDRVNTTYAVWQSTTMGCVQCHSHPYDPFRHEEYYKSMAFFNNTRDEDTQGEHPNLRMYDGQDEKKLAAIKSWVHQYATPTKEAAVNRFLRTLEPKYHAHDCDQFINGALVDTKFLGIRDGGSVRLRQVNLEGKSNLVLHYWTSTPGGVIDIRKDRLDGDRLMKISLDTTGKGQRSLIVPFQPVSGKHDLFFVFRNAHLKPDQSVCGVEWLSFLEDLPGKGEKNFEGIEEDFADLVNANVDNLPVMVESNADLHRETHVFERGNWMVKGKLVDPEPPRSLNPFDKDLPRNRLGFARWLLSKDNPLTGRTVVNQVWEQIFGNGLVETMEDFGTQGALPSHPELLDWLALRFMDDHHWSIKKLIKDLVMSATYQQDSRVTPALLEKDPGNKWLARGPRVRLSAEQIRDQALALSGLLSKKMYGRPVMPFQPDGVWQVVYSDERWATSQGEDQYRRGVYTFQKRTSPYPSMLTFDGSSREVCTIRRIRTNTPLQALVTLNDPVYLDAARAMARHMMNLGKSPAERISAGYRDAVFHPVSKENLEALLALYDAAWKEYSGNKEAAAKFLNAREARPDLAAMTIVASAILNLDELLTKE